MSATPLYSAQLIPAVSKGIKLVTDEATKFTLPEMLTLSRLGITAPTPIQISSPDPDGTGTIPSYTNARHYLATGLPTGLACDTAGAITGTPTASGTFMVVVEVNVLDYTPAYISGYVNYPATQNEKGVAIIVIPMVVEAAPAIGSLEPPTPDSKIVFMDQELATGVTVNLRPQENDTYTEIWQISGLPPGLTVNNGNYITGTPTAPGVYVVTVSLTYNLAYGGAFSEEVRVFTFTVTQGVPVISTSGFTSVYVNDGYIYPLSLELGAVTTVQLAATGTPTSWSATGLPSGLTIDDAGLITGTPLTEGIYDVAIVATNSAGNSTPFVARFTVVTPPLSGVLPESGIDLFFDVQSRDLLLNVPKAEQVLSAGATILNESGIKKLAIKNGETLRLNLRFIKGGNVIDPDATGIRFGVAPRAGAPLLLDSSAFTKIGLGSMTRHVLYVEVASDEFTSLFDTYFDDEAVEDAETLGDTSREIKAVCEVELTTGSGPTLAKLRSNSLEATIMRSIF